METKPPSPKQKDVKPQRQSSVSNDVLKEAADTAAYRVADAEHKSYLADEAVKETERLSCLAEQNDAMLLLAQKLYEQCNVDKYAFILVSEFANSVIFSIITNDLVGLFMQVCVVKRSTGLKLVNARLINRFILILICKNLVSSEMIF